MERESNISKLSTALALGAWLRESARRDVIPASQR